MSKYAERRHRVQMRAATISVIETSLESSFQLVLQLVIICPMYETFLTPDVIYDPTQRKQLFAVSSSLLAVIWSYASYHRLTKFGGLTLIGAAPLILSLFAQVNS